MEAVGSAAALVQLVGVAKDLFQYLADVKDASRQSKTLRQELGMISDLVGQLEIELKSSSTGSSFTTSPTLQNSFGEFRKLLGDMEARVNASKTEGFMRLKWPFTKDQNNDYLSKIERYKTTFSVALEIKTA
jgi:hypothetical protein